MYSYAICDTASHQRNINLTVHFMHDTEINLFKKKFDIQNNKLWNHS